MNRVFEIKFKDEVIPAKALMLVKNKTGLSLSKIKTAAQQSDAFFGCGLSEDHFLEVIIEMYDQLKCMKVETLLFMNGEAEKIDVIKNVLESHKDTARELGLDEDYMS